MVLGAAGLHLVDASMSEAQPNRAFGAVQVALHQAKRDRGPCASDREFHRRVAALHLNDTVDETEPRRRPPLDSR